ncbi:MAG: hypothetical protein RSD67_05185 [Oscillospiraceae bacterium]
MGNDIFLMDGILVKFYLAEVVQTADGKYKKVGDEKFIKSITTNIIPILNERVLFNNDGVFGGIGDKVFTVIEIATIYDNEAHIEITLKEDNLYDEN